MLTKQQVELTEKLLNHLETLLKGSRGPDQPDSLSALRAVLDTVRRLPVTRDDAIPAPGDSVYAVNSAGHVSERPAEMCAVDGTTTYSPVIPMCFSTLEAARKYAAH